MYFFTESLFNFLISIFFKFNFGSHFLLMLFNKTTVNLKKEDGKCKVGADKENSDDFAYKINKCST